MNELQPEVLQHHIQTQVRMALSEDLGGDIDVLSDVTAQLIAPQATALARVISRED